MQLGDLLTMCEQSGIRIFNEDIKEISYAPTMIMEIGDAPHELYEGT